jgi:hypothetical protein
MTYAALAVTPLSSSVNIDGMMAMNNAFPSLYVIWMIPHTRKGITETRDILACMQKSLMSNVRCMDKRVHSVQQVFQPMINFKPP